MDGKNADSVLAHCSLRPGDTLRDALVSLERSAAGIVLILDDDGKLQAVATDGDLRRAVLASIPLGTTLEAWAPGHTGVGTDGGPVTAPVDADPAELLHLMNEKGVEQVPLLDPEGRPVRLVHAREFLTELERDHSVTALVMAGGLGTRLKSLTEKLPKPMLPVGDRPLMEHIIDQIRGAGIETVSISTHYMPQAIVEHFGDGDRFGVKIDYVEEGHPLGTAGAIGLLNELQSPLLVMNGDILTRVDLRAFSAYHRENDALMTVAVRKYDVQVPYGVVETNGSMLDRIVEKPVHSFFVNAGIYLMEPAVQGHIERGQRLDMTDLIERLLDAGERIAVFPVLEYWLDIGQPEDYERAKSDGPSVMQAR